MPIFGYIFVDVSKESVNNLKFLKSILTRLTRKTFLSLTLRPVGNFWPAHDPIFKELDP